MTATRKIVPDQLHYLTIAAGKDVCLSVVKYLTPNHDDYRLLMKLSKTLATIWGAIIIDDMVRQFKCRKEVLIAVH
jgi:hypothetical protein